MEVEALRYVGFWRRTVATLVDSGLLLLLQTPMLVMIYGDRYWSETGAVAGPADFVITYVLPAIAVLVFWEWRQATPGKMMLSARIVDADTGDAPAMWQWCVRYLSYLISALPLCLGFVWAGFDARKQGWHDKLARTVVVMPDQTVSAVRFPKATETEKDRVTPQVP